MKDDSADTRPLPGRSLRAAPLTAAVASMALLAAACGGGSHPAGSSVSRGQRIAQKMAAFAGCMRTHGEPGFYYANPQGSQRNTRVLALGEGYFVTGVDSISARFASAMTACHHLLPNLSSMGSPPVPRQQLDRLLRFTVCMRHHGYPGFPDPAMQNGHVLPVSMPSSIATTSPRFQAAQKACGAGQ
jgi:hypothetical protein